MTLSVDPEILAVLAAAPPRPEPPAVGDVATRRERIAATYEVLSQGLPVAGEVTATDHVAATPDGHEVPLRYYVPAGQRPRGAAVYLHGGGMIGGSIETHDRICRRYVADAGVGLLSVDYRLAPEHPAPAQAEDACAALAWMAENAAELGVDPTRIGIAGDSGGGAVAASAALLARDRGGPALALVLLVYPMLDDRNTVPDARLVPMAVWTYDDNTTAWSAVIGTGSPTQYAAAARATDLSGLPPTYLDVGDLDIFCDETVAYAGALMRAGVETELHVHRGAMHGFDLFVPGSGVASRAHADRIRVLSTLVRP